jgi:hypothetical protein
MCDKESVPWKAKRGGGEGIGERNQGRDQNCRLAPVLIHYLKDGNPMGKIHIETITGQTRTLGQQQLLSLPNTDTKFPV